MLDFCMIVDGQNGSIETVNKGNHVFPCKELGIYFQKKISNNLSPQINIKSYQSQSLSIMKNLLQLAFCFELCQVLRPMLETFHTPMIKIMYTPTHMLYFYTRR